MSDSRNDKRGTDRDYDNNNNFSRKRMYVRKKVCRFCADKNLVINYKEIDTLRRFITEGGKIIPKRISGNCSKHQRILSNAIKISRSIALLPYIKN